MKTESLVNTEIRNIFVASETVRYQNEMNTQSDKCNTTQIFNLKYKTLTKTSTYLLTSIKLQQKL